LFERALDSLDGFLGGGEFLCGAELSVADISVFAEIDGLDRALTPEASELIRKRTNVASWLARMRPLVRA
ncbi:MAG: glutathione S-transferase C-terminal domain-containing protein, partial [Candidatus Binataceae bacterium]